MKKSVELRQEKAGLLERMEAINTAAASEGMTDEQRQQFNELRTQVEALNTQIQNQEFLEEEQRAAATAEAKRRESEDPRRATEKKTEKQRVIEDYRITRAVGDLLKGKSLTGLEAEMNEEGQREAKECGVTTEGNLQIPSMFYARQQKRDLTAGTDTAGGHTIATEIGNLIPLLEPRLMVESMGATMLRGLTGNLKFPRGNADATAVWEGENDANAETSPTFDSVSMSPNRLGAFTDVSKQLMFQSTIDAENYVRRRLNFAVAKGIDLAAINGSGSGNEPEGILNVTGIGDVAGGANGATPDFGHLVDLETEIAVDNADMGRLGYLTTPGIRGYLKKTITDAGSGNYIWPVNATTLNGYGVGISTQVPNNLTKGTSSGVCHAIIFGNWEELLIGQWAGLDLVVDPYTGAKNALVTLVINSWWDVAVRHAESFAAMKDALTS